MNRGKCTNQKRLFSSICANPSPTIFFGEETLMLCIENGSFVNFVQCGFEVPEEFAENTADFRLVKEPYVRQEWYWFAIKVYAKNERLSMLINWCFSEGGVVDKLFLSFDLDSLLVFKEFYYFVQYTPMKSLNNFFQSAKHARKEEYENPSFSFVAETNNSLGNKFL